MHFNPIEKDEWDQKDGFLTEGEANFVITDVTEGVTQAGDPKLIVEFEATQGNKKGTIKDHISSKARFKIIGLCNAIGNPKLKDCAQKGELTPSDLMRQQGRFELKNREYDGKNYLNIFKFIVAEAPVEPEFNDDLPF